VRDLRASVEVRALIGAEQPRELHGDPVQDECWQCGRTGQTTEPTSVIALGAAPAPASAGGVIGHSVAALLAMPPAFLQPPQQP